jgi:hypothetical protein
MGPGRVYRVGWKSGGIEGGLGDFGTWSEKGVETWGEGVEGDGLGDL